MIFGKNLFIRSEINGILIGKTISEKVFIELYPVKFSKLVISFLVNQLRSLLKTLKSKGKVILRDSDNCYLTMNGENMALQSTNRDLPSGVYVDSFIGGVDGGSGVKPGVRGEIDDIRIYNRALSAEEVKALYELEKPKNK